ncbi:MAG: hypothetical protein GWN37_05140 [Gammaproteobacteria bacterium]|nr:hypothetical protein [Gammaproteobacteria bacterium]
MSSFTRLTRTGGQWRTPERSTYLNGGPLVVLVGALVFWMAPGTSPAAADAGVVRELDNRLQLVGQYIRRSPSAVRVERSGNAQAKEWLEQARQFHSQAVAARAAGRHYQARIALQKSSIAMFEAVRVAAGPKEDVQLAKEQRLDDELRARLDSADSLLRAHRRIRAEKELGSSDGRALEAAIQTDLGRVRALIAQGRAEEARTILDRSYRKVAHRIAALRGGETLVSALPDDPREAYRYELARNEAHDALIRKVMDGHLGDAETKGRLQPLLDETANLRSQAKIRAARGNYEGAAEGLQRSTKRLMRALRGAAHMLAAEQEARPRGYAELGEAGKGGPPTVVRSRGRGRPAPLSTKEAGRP